MNERSIAKVLAFKAYLLGKQTPEHEIATHRAKAEYAAHVLQGQQTADSYRRQVFYNLFLAELARNTDPVPYRIAAADAGDRLSELGYADPMPIYMKIVEATTERLTTAHFGDFKSSPCWSHSVYSSSPLVESQVFHANISHALAAAEIDADLAADFDDFLRTTSLDEIMTKHGFFSESG
jgi:hypothetical protein